MSKTSRKITIQVEMAGEKRKRERKRERRGLSDSREDIRRGMNRCQFEEGIESSGFYSRHTLWGSMHRGFRDVYTKEQRTKTLDVYTSVDRQR